MLSQFINNLNSHSACFTICSSYTHDPIIMIICYLLRFDVYIVFIMAVLLFVPWTTSKSFHTNFSSAVCINFNYPILLFLWLFKHFVKWFQEAFSGRLCYSFLYFLFSEFSPYKRVINFQSLSDSCKHGKVDSFGSDDKH